MAHKIIAISRQFGSGGREIGMLVARRLGINAMIKSLSIWLPNMVTLNTKGSIK